MSKPKNLADLILNDIGIITNEFRAQELASTFEGYDTDVSGNMISCCGTILDPDVMICTVCKEHN